MDHTLKSRENFSATFAKNLLSLSELLEEFVPTSQQNAFYALEFLTQLGALTSAVLKENLSPKKETQKEDQTLESGAKNSKPIEKSRKENQNFLKKNKIPTAFEPAKHISKDQSAQTRLEKELEKFSLEWNQRSFLQKGTSTKILKGTSVPTL